MEIMPNSLSSSLFFSAAYPFDLTNRNDELENKTHY
jgi:hypothetical protein